MLFLRLRKLLHFLQDSCPWILKLISVDICAAWLQRIKSAELQA